MVCVCKCVFPERPWSKGLWQLAWCFQLDSICDSMKVKGQGRDSVTSCAVFFLVLLSNHSSGIKFKSCQNLSMHGMIFPFRGAGCSSWKTPYVLHVVVCVFFFLQETGGNAITYEMGLMWPANITAMCIHVALISVSSQKDLSRDRREKVSVSHLHNLSSQLQAFFISIPQAATYSHMES